MIDILRARHSIVSLLAGALLAITGATPALASEVAPLQVEVAPATGPAGSYFSVRARAGRRGLAGRLLLINRSRHPLTLDLAPVRALTASTLGSAYALPGDGGGPARWTALSPRTVRLRVGARTAVGVAARVPRGTAGGQYLSGISVEVRHPLTTQRIASGVGVSSVIRYAIGLEVTVPGRLRPRLAWTGARLEQQPGGLSFLLAARNRGNSIAQHVTGSILITSGRRTVVAAAIGPGTFVSDTAIEYPVRAPGTPGPGTVYRVRALLRYDHRVARLDTTLRFGERQARVREQFGGPPVRAAAGSSGATWVAIAAAAIILLAAAFALGLRRGRR